ncbi:MAG: deoxyguanosinetriphosphate triphosphohydrolase [Planctomycetota bacterium]
MSRRDDSPKPVRPEARPLACAMQPARSRGRAHPEEEHPYRDAFQRDRDRIVHSTAFRRLEYKTQVFVNYEGDHYRTRLTHTLEVAQIARSLARALGLNEDLTEAIALAHDLGHTPFGHSGEDTLSALMKDHGGFEHNAQGLRVADLLEHRYPDFLGLNLTYEVREAFATHSTRHDFPEQWADFHTDEQPTLEAQIVSVADEIAYDNHDLDDGLRSGLLREEEVGELAICRRVRESRRWREGKLAPPLRWAQIIRGLIDLEVTDVIVQSRRNLKEAGIRSVEDVRRHSSRLLQPSGELSAMKTELEDFLLERFYNSFTVRRMSNKACAFLTELFQAYVRDPSMLPPEHQVAVEDYGVERAVCDYIAGMTDRFAQQEYRKLFHPFERT